MKTLLWILGGIVVIALIVLAWFVLFPGVTPAPGTGSNSLPAASSTMYVGGTSGGTSGTTGTTTQSFQVQSQVGPISMNNFLTNGVTAADVENAGKYYLTGSPGYCLQDGTCPHGASTTDFIVTFNTTSQFFTIALTAEPIGQARAHAEQFLMATLGIGQTQMCILQYYVGTDVNTNSFYSGKNLGFSFCPGATKLPE